MPFQNAPQAINWQNLHPQLRDALQRRAQITGEIPPQAMPPGTNAPIPRATPPNMGSIVAPPQAMPPQAMPPQAMPPQAMPPQAMPPQAMPPQAMPPGTNAPPQAMPPQAMPPQAMPPAPNLGQMVQGRQQAQNSLFTPENGQFGARMPQGPQGAPGAQSPQGAQGAPGGGQSMFGGNAPQNAAQPQGSPGTAGRAFAAGGYADGGVPGQNPFTQALQQAQMQASMPMLGGQGQGAAPAGMDQAQFQSLMSGAQQGAMSDEQRANLLNAMMQKRGQAASNPAAGGAGGLPSLIGGGQ